MDEAATPGRPLRKEAYISAAFPDVPREEVEADVRTFDRVARLVERARQGDREAFGDLYRMHHARVFRMARFYVGDAAEDAVSETFMRAWVALPRYRQTGAPFVAWLYGIARHVVIDEMARRRRVEPRDELPDRGYVRDEDDRILLAEAMARLPREQRQVLELKFLVGLTNAEVASALGKTPGAVNAQQWRALQALRKEMAGQ